MAWQWNIQQEITILADHVSQQMHYRLRGVISWFSKIQRL